MKIYQGEIKRMYTTGIEENDGILTYLLTSSVIKQNAIFYLNRFGRLISEDFGVYLPTEEEAKDYVINHTNRNPNSKDNSCVFVDYVHVKETEISKDTYKKLTLSKK